jgi:5-methylthioadenosine/S-adenosylhomocysteine deaminase
LIENYRNARERHFPNAVILPGLINSHSHLELTAMRGFLEDSESDFASWLRKLTVARLSLFTSDDLHVSALWGAVEALRAGVTAVADASDSAGESMKALKDIGMRGVVFQESFGPDPKLADENLAKLKTKIAQLTELQTPLVKVGVSPHASYTVSGLQLELISEFALTEGLPVMMHAAESKVEEMLLQEGRGLFAEGLAQRGIEWKTPGMSTVQYLGRHGVLQTKPLLAHCIRVNEADIGTLRESGARVAHCPKSNAKLGHGRAPFPRLLEHGVSVGLGSDSVASNNTCDILDEARFAALLARSEAVSLSGKGMVSSADVMHAATIGGAQALELENHTGELRTGLQADFAVVAIDRPHQLPLYDPIDTLVFASSGRDVVLTVVAGKELFSGGRVTTVDEERLAARINEIAAKLGAANME